MGDCARYALQGNGYREIEMLTQRPDYTVFWTAEVRLQSYGPTESCQGWWKRREERDFLTTLDILDYNHACRPEHWGFQRKQPS